MKRNFRIPHTALMLALAAAYPALSHGAAGTAQFTAGDVSVKRGNAAPKPLAKGAEVESGDSIVTGARGIAQLKFSDGGYVAIQPNSQFDLTRYADKGDPAQDNFLVGLARGGMRAITGLIGKRNRANYQVTTNTATVGIRGSAFNLAYNADGTLSVATEQDAIEVCTAAGCIGLTAGESALVPNNQSLPVRTDVRSTMPTAPYRQDPVVAGNQVNSDGTAQIVPIGPRVLAGLSFAGAGLTLGEGLYADSFSSGDGALTVQGGRPTAYLGSSGGQGAITEGGTTEVHHTQGSLATGDYMVLGTWSSGQWDYGEGSSYTYTPLAFVAGVPTSSAAISNLSGSSATYSLRQASPVYSASGFVGTLNSANLGVDFTTGTGNIDLSVSMNYSGGYGGSGSAVYDYYGSVSGNGAGFSGSLHGSGYGYVNGFFSGSGAENAGISYNASSSYNGNIAGAAILGRDTQSFPLAGTYTTLVAYHSGEGIYSDYSESSQLFVPSTGSSSIAKSYGYFDYTGSYENTGTNTTHRVVGNPGDAAYLNLGTWSGSRFVETGEGSSYVSNYGAASYVAGTQTDSTTIAGLSGQTGTYSLLAGSPIHMSNGETGALHSADLTVNFGGASNTGHISLGMTLGSAGSHTLAGDIRGSGAMFYDDDGLVLSGGEGGYGSVQGFFSGSGAQYAGITYTGYASAPNSNFGGAAILGGSVGGTPAAVMPDDGTYSGVTTLAFGVPFASALSITGDHVFSGGGPVSADDGSGNSYGGASFAERGDNGGTGDNFIGWGTWNGGASYGGSAGALNNVHYIVGKPTAASEFNSLSGSYQYDRVGNTTPTATGATGGVLQSASLTAHFTGSSGGTVDASVSTLFSGGQASAMTANGMAISTTTASFSGNDTSGGSGRIAGMFVGAGAGYAGFTYRIDDGVIGTVAGSVGFSKGAFLPPP